MRFDTLAIHAAQPPDPQSGAVMTPIVLASTFAQDGPGKHKGYEYARTGNPTRNALEGCLAALEGARHGIAFASGCAATTTLLLTLRPGDHVVCCDDVYGGTFRIFDKVLRPLGVESDRVDLSRDVGALRGALRPTTRMVWIETPTNPLLKIIDIAELATLTHAASAKLVVDNTFATPALQRPLAFGADVVLHSTTKYLNGHSDVVGGAICLNDDPLAERLRFLQNAVGAVPSPFDCYLVLRGLKTLPVRMRAHVAGARAVVEFLRTRGDVKKVVWPGLDDHPGHALASRQMSAPGGMVTFEVEGGVPRASALLAKLRVFHCAESLGGVESLAELPSVMTHGSIPPELRRAAGIDDGLIRLSVGLEDPLDLVDDLRSALDATR
ncbi:MAG: aminotransferase class I/II-fold pyridoxal phosphate-dependent enzyme [Deltaproteobacteria bacterium]|nr:aminotransferase class I/II-fold pyridoxal phosphate-dependent enzyme [Deltaproteobacteria bacterium]